MTYNLEDILYLKYEREQKVTTLVLVDAQVICFESSLSKVLQHFCLRNGSTMQGRLNFFAYQQHIRQKVPLLVCERKEVIFFPLYGKRHPHPI